jgi:predicted 3-demethylubiquinone-9 3-methyltransferase (glyoxalase superfamily)
MADLPKTRLCLMLGDGVQEAATFYARTFPDSRVEAV